MFDVKKKVNEGLSKLATGIQVNSSSCMVWGEVELPECLREEIEQESKDVEVA